MLDVTSLTNSVNTIVIISVVVPLLIMALVFFRVLVPLMRSSANNNKLLQKGLPAQARILRTWDTGVTINDNPRVGFLLEVQPSERPAFQAQAQMLVSLIHLPQYQPGAILEVRYDPANPNKVAIVGVANQTMYSSFAR